MTRAAPSPARRISSREDVPLSIAALSRSAASPAVTTRTVMLRVIRAVPGIVLLEGLVEVVNAEEFVATVLRLAEQEAELHEGEDDIADVGGRFDSPEFENEACHHAVPLQGEIAASASELLPRDVPARGKPRLAVLERGE